jgi:AmmeMemoRadiSam system protein B
MAKVRHPSVAGTFYEGNAQSLKKQIEDCFLHRLGPGKIPEIAETGQRQIVGLVCPHAGYEYSGPVAAHAYFELAMDGKPDIVAILGPNHRGFGSGLAAVNEGFWHTPLGDVEVDSETANQIVRESRIIDIDESAHLEEHSIEVQLPFLQYLYGSELKIVPICFLLQDLVSAQEVGQAVGKVLAGRNAIVIASSDMTHYETQRIAETKDLKALKAVESMDEARFYSVIEADNVTTCGYGPVAALITSSRILGGKEAKLLCYKTSGDVTGDYSQVVGYAAVCFKK